MFLRARRRSGRRRAIIKFGAGDCLLADDIDTKGHYTTDIGTEPRTMVSKKSASTPTGSYRRTSQSEAYVTCDQRRPDEAGIPWVAPPQTEMTWPVMYDASSLQRKPTVWAISHTSPIRPSMFIRFCISGLGVPIEA